VDRDDAVFNLQRVVLLVNSLQTENYSLLREALQDRLHQPYRQALVPGLEDLLHVEHPDLLGVCLSGAGPSVVGFAQHNVHLVAKLLERIYARTGRQARVRILRAHPSILQSTQTCEQAAKIKG
jgi:homoserine kinase